MSLDDLFMPRPAPAPAKRVMPLGEWPQKPVPMTREQYAAKERARKAAARLLNRDHINASQRARRRARRAANG